MTASAGMLMFILAILASSHGYMIALPGLAPKKVIYNMPLPGPKVYTNDQVQLR